MEILPVFVAYACKKGYNAALIDDFAVISDVQNPGNDFKIMKTEDKYAVYTIRTSKFNYEYTAKCVVYLLLAEYNRDNADTSHNHINFKVDL